MLRVIRDFVVYRLNFRVLCGYATSSLCLKAKCSREGHLKNPKAKLPTITNCKTDYSLPLSFSLSL